MSRSAATKGADMTATAQMPDHVRDAFNAVLAERLDARVEAVNVHTSAPEFSVVITNPGRDRIGGHGTGLLHEEIVRLIEVAEAHGARLWWQFSEEPCLLWPSDMPRGPIGQETDVAEEQRAARNGVDERGEPKTRVEAVSS
jgi:hypothetical protein